MHSCICDLDFGFLKNFGVFEVFVKFLGWVTLIWCYMIMHCIPLAFSQCFMHLDVCLIVKSCVLVGLDWVSTHGAIFVSHITCSCIFHAYVSFFISFYVLYCDCVLSSLSLSFLDRLCMAPKQQKSTSA